MTPQNWLFLGSYRKLRARLLINVRWDSVTRLGAHAFETIGGEVVNVAFLTLARQKPGADHQFVGLDVSEEKTPAEKAEGLRTSQFMMVGQKEQLDNPDSVITLEKGMKGTLLQRHGRAWQGLVTGDDNRCYFNFWELNSVSVDWLPLQQAPQTTLPFTGRDTIVRWEAGRGDLHKSPTSHNFPPPLAIGRQGIAIQRMHSLNVTFFSGDIFDDSVAPLIVDAESLLPAIWTFCNSIEYAISVRKMSQHLKVVPGTLTKIPFDLDHWQKVAAEKYPNGLPKPHSDDPTQWLFNGHPKGSEAPLQVAVARMVGYRWPRQTGSSFPDCPGLEVDGLEKHADADGIVCINTVHGELSAVDRLRTLLAEAFGVQWGEERQKELLAGVGFEGRLLGDWLRDGFFEQHCRLFQQRPFIWQVCDGNRAGFSALVNYHNLTRATLEKLVYAYLGDWISRQCRAVDSGEEGSDDRLDAAQGLKSKLEEIIAGEPPFDLFVRWKPLSKQAIGWAPDLNDGVRLNMRPFVLAGVLRKNPKVNWGKDKGREPQRDRHDFPWFWGWDGETPDWVGGKIFTGERFNDCHYSVAAKRHAIQDHK